MFLFRPRTDRKVVDLPIARILGNPYQPRRDVDEKHLRQLTQSIATHGVIVPIIVRPREGTDQYELVAGQRRLLACKRLGWKHVPAVVRHYDDQQVMEVGLLENIQRSNLSTVEEAEALFRLSREVVRLSRSELARRMGVDPDELKLREELLGLSMVAREAVITGLITTEHALALLPLESEQDQIQMLTRIHREDLSVSQTRRMVEALLAERRRARHEEPVAAPAETPSSPTSPPPAPGGGAWDEPLVERLEGLYSAFRNGGAPAPEAPGALADELLSAMRRTAPADFLELGDRERHAQARHAWNVAKLASFVSERLGASQEDLRTTALAGLLYDVGMAEVPSDILAKPGALAEEELSRVRRHSEEGAAMLARLQGLPAVVVMAAREHHERCDGTGYPAGLREDQIHPLSRLIALADSFEAATAHRAHRPACTPRMAMQAIVLNTYRGIYDRSAVRAFLQALSLYPVGSLVRLGTGEIARVVRAIPTDVTRPVVEVMANGKPRSEIDLSQSPGITISDETVPSCAAGASR